MIFKANVVAAALALATTTLAASLSAPADPAAGICLTGTQCCQALLSIASVNAVAVRLGIADVILAPFVSLGGSLGVDCKPAGTEGCPACAKSVCCLNNAFGGTIAWGCT